MCYRSVYCHVELSNCVNYLKIVYVLYAVSETLFTHMEYDFILPVYATKRKKIYRVGVTT